MTVVEEPPAPTKALPRAKADLKVEVNAGEGAQVAQTRRHRVPRHQVSGGQASRARQYTHVHRGLSAKTGEAVKRKKFKGAVQGFAVEAGGRLGPAAKKFINGSAKCQSWRGKQ